MTAWISQWLREIILIVLFAAFVDLLLPNNALQRYVKVAVSLMILLTILSPVVKLLRSDLDLQQKTVQAIGSITGELPPLAAVLEAGGKLRVEAEGRSARLVEQQLASMIRDELASELSVYADQVEVRVLPSGEDGEAKLSQVRLVLSENGEGDEGGELQTQAASSGQISAGIRSIEPVQVRVSWKESDATMAAQMDASVETSDRIQTRKHITAHLRQWLGVEDLAVLIDWKTERKRT